MKKAPVSLLSTLDVSRVARLFGKLCLKLFTAEVTFIVGTRPRTKVPVFYLETLNLVLKDTDDLGGGKATPSACLPGGSKPIIEFDPKSQEIRADFDVRFDLPAARRGNIEEVESDTPGPTAVTTSAQLRGRFLGKLQPREFAYQNFECELSIKMPEEFVERLGVKRSIELQFKIPLVWIYILSLRKELCLQPVFIAADGATPPTGSDYYPLLSRANEIWAKCCIQFRSKCPIYVDEQGYRISTAAEATAFKDEVDVDDAIEVFVVERLDPESTWGGGATFASGTAAAKIVTGDNQLPVNQNHLAHELGHVLGLGHPANPGGLVAGCDGSVMEPSGFFADNPEFQCRSNCREAANPLLTTLPFRYCLTRNRPDDELF